METLSSTTAVGNAINFLGIALLMVSHYAIAMGIGEKRAFQAAFVGSALVAAGSFVLESYPVMGLYIAWGLMALVGISRFRARVSGAWRFILFGALVVFGLSALALGDYEFAAYVSSCVFVLGFLLFSLKTLSRLGYLLCGCVGCVMLVPHLIEVQSFSLLVNEAFGFSVGAAGILKIIIEKRGMIDSPFETKN